MAAIDYAGYPESTWQSLLAASYKLTLELFQDPAVRAEYEVWRAKRKAAQQAAKREEEQSASQEIAASRCTRPKSGEDIQRLPN